MQICTPAKNDILQTMVGYCTYIQQNDHNQEKDGLVTHAHIAEQTGRGAAFDVACEQRGARAGWNAQVVFATADFTEASA